MKKVILLLSVLMAIAVGWFLYFNKGEVSAIVGVNEVAYGDLENTLEFSGEVMCTDMYSVMSETGGTVFQSYVSEGSHVDIGDRLFDLDSSSVEAQLKEARLKAEVLSDAAAQTVMAGQGSDASLSEQQQAAVALALSQTTGYDMESFNEALGNNAGEKAAAAAATIGDKLSNLSNMQNSDTASDSASLDADSQLKLAELTVEQLQETLDKMRYTSRISGTVLTVNINQGEVLAPGVPAMVIANTDSTDIVGYVYEKDIDDLETDMDVTIVTEDGNYQGKLARIGKAAADIGESSTFDTMTKVTITPEEGFKKMPGAVVDMKVILSAKSGVLTIPADCLMEDNCVFVVGENDIVEKRQVVTGFKDMFNIEVVDGLSEGELVVASPDGAKEGQHVSYDRG